MRELLSYREADQWTWASLCAWREPGLPPPMTAHQPVQPPHGSCFVQVEPSLALVQRRVYRGMRLDTEEPARTAMAQPRWALLWALEQNPALVDFRATRMTLAQDRYPVVTADAPGRGLHYAVQYAALPAPDAAQAVIAVTLTVRNISKATRHPVVWLKLDQRPEANADPYHYEPYQWTRDNWRDCTAGGWEQGYLTLEGQRFARLVPGSWQPQWYDGSPATRPAQREDEEQLKRLGFIRPELLLSEPGPALTLTTELAPNATASFSLLLLAEPTQAGPAALALLDQLDPVTAPAQAVTNWSQWCDLPHAQLECASERLGAALDATRLSTLQLLASFPGDDTLMPTQGGSSERFYVWTWEACFMLMPLLRLGHTTAVRQALAHLFSFQDGGCLPEGDLAPADGAIGTTGPRWLNTTGAALGLAAEYALCAEDADFLPTFLPRIRRAVSWIRTQLLATRCIAPDGTEPLASGLMPFGRATDGDVGLAYAITDAYTYWGLARAAQLLVSLDDPQATELTAFCADYRRRITRALTAMAEPDGNIRRALPTGRADEYIYPGFDVLCGAAHLLFCGAVAADHPAWPAYINHMETHAAWGPFTAPMTPHVMYIGVNELLWQDVYLRQGQWKKAFLTLLTVLRYGMANDTFSVQERYAPHEPAFNPWQPNGSGNGRLQQMLINALYHEQEKGAVVLMGALPWPWLVANGTTAWRRLRVPGGQVEVQVEMQDHNSARLTLRGPAPALPRRVRVPEHFRPAPQRGLQPATTSPWHEVIPGAAEVSFIVHAAP